MTTSVLILISTPVWLLAAAVWWNAKTQLIQEDWQWADPVNQPKQAGPVIQKEPKA